MANPTDPTPPVFSPTAEAGYTTTEFWATAATALITAIIGLVSAFGLHVTDAQRAGILGVAGAIITLVVGAYTVSRGVRKSGTPG